MIKKYEWAGELEITRNDWVNSFDVAYSNIKWDKNTIEVKNSSGLVLKSFKVQEQTPKYNWSIDTMYYAETFSNCLNFDQDAERWFIGNEIDELVQTFFSIEEYKNLVKVFEIPDIFKPELGTKIYV